MDDLVKCLNKDIEGEHRAIVQYLYHAWQVTDEALRGKLESLARDEMRHLEWLSEELVQLGAKPDLRRGQVVREGTLRDLLAADLKDEKDAIVAYGERIRMAEKAGRPELALVLERILRDEEGHRDFLQRALAELPGASSLAEQAPGGTAGRSQDEAAEGVSRGPATTSGAAGGDSETLQWGIQHEYEVIMDYVLHALASGNAEARHELLDLAIDEMKHLGWLAEHLTESGGRPELESVRPPAFSPLKVMLERSLSTEGVVARKYDEGARRTPDDETKRLLERIRLDELHHENVFRKMLSWLGRGKTEKPFTVGSLKKEV
ncbi:MAG: ferritin-like domain-containing protein [Firmicutes bacterium]|nr:ferritin-like domain-containing protein [Candidatus Fermentithermobacillaceae bacterium]